MSQQLAEDKIELDASEKKFTRQHSMALLVRVLKPLRKELMLSIIYVVAAMGLNTLAPWLIAYTLNNALNPLREGNSQPMLVSLAVFGAAVILAGVFVYLNIVVTTRLSQKALYALRLEMFDHAQKLSVGFHEKYTAGRVISRLTSDLETLKAFLDSGLSQLAAAALSMVFSVIALFVIEWRAGVGLLVMMVPVALLTVWFQRRSSVAFRAQRVESAQLIGRFTETFGSIRAIKAFNNEARARSVYGEKAEDYRLRVMDSVKIFGLYLPSLLGAGTVFVAVVLVVGGHSVLEGAMQVGTLLALVIYANRIFEPVFQMSQFYNQLQSAVSALEKVSGFLAEVPQVAEPARPVQRTQPAAGHLEFRDTSFEYLPGRPALHPFNLDIPAGQQVALVGKTGAGKSTLAKLVARFYDLTEGSLTLDGVAVSDLADEQLRREVVMVTQEAFLFTGTISENIRLGRPEATDQEVEDAARAVGAHGFISMMPEGYNTDLSKRGGSVSAGQRQLISFARAFLVDPAVLILDEATASLDIPSERLVQAGLEKLLAGRTSLVIAHRLSTVLTSDRILVIDDGTIVEDGSPTQLIESGGRFAQLHASWEESMAI
ncbi:ABC transporter ATP-binding protein [Rothia sp. ZJ1223]|uniref:ABC transporter ATP-binding protein n=1 Tax=Rothia sp. ZJ1223 TaxID=2811098 RepID=UPI00351CAF89